MAYGFVSDESEATYQWLLERLKDVIQPNTDGSMLAFVTDKYRALMKKKLDTLFPESAKLFCIWHMMNNIKSSLRGWFKSKETKK